MHLETMSLKERVETMDKDTQQLLEEKATSDKMIFAFEEQIRKINQEVEDMNSLKKQFEQQLKEKYDESSNLKNIISD